ncbi:hypothetical protein ACHHYP_09567 [Achlya hypogyna]|uniref:Ion transport domain-containing protein n=1 Tax=Achlya hypogyna TaxID=1202772 RepID=A0A1V9YMZ2_ACHHY|nr:hypothetical protein ACHHYP_09567 [Achlya hypogyna]
MQSLSLTAATSMGYGSIATAEEEDRYLMSIETHSDAPEAIEEEVESDDEEDPDEFTDMLMAELVLDGKVMVVKHRIENHLFTEDDLIYKDSGVDVLTMAASLGYNEIVELVLTKTNFRLIDEYESAPLVTAAENNHKRVVQTLLVHLSGALDLASIVTSGNHPLVHAMAELGHNEILEMLLTAGAPVDAIEEDGETALHFAARSGNARGVELLLLAGANTDVVTPVGLLCRPRHLLMSSEGKTPLHHAVELCADDVGAKTVLELLLMAEAALDIQDNEGHTAADVADDPERRRLLDAEATFRATCPVHCMVRNGDSDKLLRWLVQSNAAVMLAPHCWVGSYRQGAEWQPLSLTVNVVPVPHEGLYRFFGADVDDIGPFTIIGEWNDDRIEARKEYSQQIVTYEGDVDRTTGVWSGLWNAGNSEDQFTFTIPLQLCPQCKTTSVPNCDEPCLECLPEGYNADVDYDTIEEQRLRLEQIQADIAQEILKRDQMGRTAIMCAAAQGRANMLTALLRFCDAKDLDIVDDSGRTALDHALSRKLVCRHNTEHKSNEATLECIELLARYGKTTVDPSRIAQPLSHVRDDGLCAGDCVATHNDVSLAELAQLYEWDRLGEILRTEVPARRLNELDSAGETVLHRIADAGKSDILEMLLAQPHLDLRLPTEYGEFALLRAARANRVKCVRMLLNAGADPLELISPDHFDYVNFRKTPLRLLSDSKALYLLQAKHELKQQYPLYYMARVRDCAQAAVHHKARQSAVHVAILARLSTEILTAIIDQSPHDVNAQDKLDETPLMVATQLGLADHVAVLLAHHADVDTVNHRKESALMMAANGGHVKIVAMLLEHLADVDLRDAAGQTVLETLEASIHATLGDLSLQERMQAPQVKIREAIRSEVRERQTSVEYRAKLAKSLADVDVETAFVRNGFSKAINCSPALGVTFLNDCVTLDRHDVHFRHLALVYGADVATSPLHALLNMNTDDPDLLFEAKTKCFEHVVMRRVLEIKWELFGMRKYFEMLLMNVLLLVAMTISAVLFHAGDTPPPPMTATSFPLLVGVLTFAFVAVGYAGVQALRPRVLWRLARFQYDGSSVFDPSLVIPNLERYKTTAKRRIKVAVLLGTFVLAAAVVGVLQVTSATAAFPALNNLVLAGCAVYFLVNEWQEARGGLGVYLASPINLIQVTMYTLILVAFLPMQLDYLAVPDQVEIAVGGLITLTLWVLSLQFLEVEETASYLLPMLTGLLKDLWNFFLFFGVFQIGITVTFYQLYKTTGDDGFNSLSGSFLTSYFVAFGQVPMDSMKAFAADDDGDVVGYDWLLYLFAVAMIMAHSALVVFFLLNLLVANMNKTVDGGLEKAKTEALAAYAQCILRLEEAMNYTPQETEALMYFEPPSATFAGVLNPIFEYAMPKAHYGITSDVEDAIAEHQKQQASWEAAVIAIESRVGAAFRGFQRGFEDVAHFTELPVAAAFAHDLGVMAAAGVKLGRLFDEMRASRGQQDRVDLLDRFQKRVSQQMATLDKQLHQIWVGSENDHARCTLIYEMAHRATMGQELAALQRHVIAVFDEAKVTIDAENAPAAKEADAAAARIAGLEAKIEELRALCATQNDQVMASMAAQFQSLLTAVQAPRE